MKRLSTFATLAAVLAFGIGTAFAGAGGPTGDSPCCAVATDGSSCKNNTGDPAGLTNGCHELDATTCLGGDAMGGDPIGPAGCICIGGTCNSVDGGDCTDSAAAACCAADVGVNCPAS